MPTLASWEARIRAHSETNRLCLTRTEVRRAAKHFARRQADVLDPDLDLRNLGFVHDPTPGQAFAAISANDVAAARRLGLRPSRPSPAAAQPRSTSPTNRPDTEGGPR